VEQFYVGVDIGSLTTKVVLVNTAGGMIAQAINRSAYSGREVAARLIAALLQEQGLNAQGTAATVATGYGRVTFPADREISEITCQARGIGAVAVAFFGDGAVNEGAFHEAANLAAVWRLPVLFVCENNLYGFSTHYRRVTAVDDLADRASSYGMPGRVVDGMDAEAVYDAAAGLVRDAREGNGPALLECKTYRFRGHSRFEPSSYRTQEELEEWKRRDPIPRLAERLRTAMGASEEALAEVEAEVSRLIDDAVKFAESSPDPAPDDWRRYLYAP